MRVGVRGQHTEWAECLRQHSVSNVCGLMPSGAADADSSTVCAEPNLSFLLLDRERASGFSKACTQVFSDHQSYTENQASEQHLPLLF